MHWVEFQFSTSLRAVEGSQPYGGVWSRLFHIPGWDCPSWQDVLLLWHYVSVRFLILALHLTRHGRFPPELSQGEISPTTPQTESTMTLQAEPQQADPGQQKPLECLSKISCGFGPFSGHYYCSLTPAGYPQGLSHHYRARASELTTKNSCQSPSKSIHWMLEILNMWKLWENLRLCHPFSFFKIFMEAFTGWGRPERTLISIPGEREDVKNHLIMTFGLNIHKLKVFQHTSSKLLSLQMTSAAPRHSTLCLGHQSDLQSISKYLYIFRVSITASANNLLCLKMSG